MNTRKTWGLREILSLIVISAVFGLLYLGWVQVWMLLQGIIGPLAMDIVFGVWFSGAIFCALMFPHPGAAFYSAMVSVITQVFAGNPSGLVMLLTGLVQGSGSEVPFLAARYRSRSLVMSLLAGLVTAQFSFVYTWFRFSYWTLEPGYVAAMWGIRSLSGTVLGGGLAYGLFRMVQAARQQSPAESEQDA
ncbi:ECF transporter S component [Spirochaeta africana]|uniref:Putative membrane protein n=1 Tax=Spirochaeta africana (strain ATCC 700263 / DSM 8902 / Z-7692) TaxID=889378 RepID=H9ULD5_SPIAZ|nr:ECF transporter S component [Spirochaeta africana]AFG38328.1 putative membrane protein [Spirochaeta africana DSM 8902]